MRAPIGGADLAFRCNKNELRELHGNSRSVTPTSHVRSTHTAAAFGAKFHSRPACCLWQGVPCRFTREAFY